MFKFTKLILLFLLFFLVLPNKVQAIVTSPEAIATFNSLGLYWTPPSATTSNSVQVKFREIGAISWFEGYPLWYSEIDHQYRGSLVHLKSGTEYEIELQVEGTTDNAILTAKTWDEDFPIAQTVYLPENSSTTLNITQSGTLEGYILYTASPGKTATIDVANNARNNIVIDAAYVIVRGVTLKGAQKDAIHIYPTHSHDVVIENNDISGWSSIKYPESGFGQDNEAAIRANTSPNVSRIIIQRNTIHDPRSDTNSWGEARPDVTVTSAGTHPVGPQAVYLYQSGGNHVIRYNTIYSSNEHRFNDCIGGGSNASNEGFPNRDSDIYGNYISHCWDNGIESEGGNKNIRIWGNYIDETYRAIANRDTRIGPLYIWRNIVNTSRKYPSELFTWEQEPHGSLGKTGGESATERGVFYFHNTSLQPTINGQNITGGVAQGLDGPMQDTTTRNNIFHTFCTNNSCDALKVTGGAMTNSFDYDLFNKPIALGGSEIHGITGVPMYNSGLFEMSSYTGDFSLRNGSPGLDVGQVISNFNSYSIKGSGPDVGAHEAGMPDMEFGVSAYPNGEPYTVKSTANYSCPADINSDHRVDLSDYSILVRNFLKTPLLNIRADINGNGVVDLSDYSILVRQFLQPCQISN